MSSQPMLPIIWDDDSPRAREVDPETSHAAADSNANRAQVEAFVLELLTEHGPLTDAQLTQRYFRTASRPEAHFDSPRKRRSDLTRKGLVVAATDEGVSPSGRRANRWRVAPVQS